jgi:hypothetical protein
MKSGTSAVAMPKAEHRKPVQLQLNNSGAWKTIVKFDADTETIVGKVMEAAIALQAVDPSAKFRISTRHSLPLVLMHLDKGDWRKV